MTATPASLATLQPRFYGWNIAWALLVVLSFSSGLSFYNHAIILDALASRPNFSVQSASFAITLFFLSAGFCGLYVARLLERYDVRYCITGGAILSCVALVLLRYVQEVWQLYVVYAIFGMGFCGSGLLPATTLITRWFVRRRSVALSIASTGLSLGGVILTPICAALVENISLKNAGPIMGLMYVLGVIPVLWLWVRPSPEAMGLEPDGAAPLPAGQKNSALTQGAVWAEAKKQRLFWGMAIAYVFLMLAQVGSIAHQYGLAKETLTEAQTAAALAILPIASIIGRLIGGWLLQSYSIFWFSASMMTLQGSALLLMSSGYNGLTLCLGLAALGITVGNLLMLQPLLIAEAFGAKDYSKIFSMSNLLGSWGTACGPALLGYVYAANGDQYTWPYVVAAMAGFIGLGFFLFSGFGRRLSNS